MPLETRATRPLKFSKQYTRIMHTLPMTALWVMWLHLQLHTHPTFWATWEFTYQTHTTTNMEQTSNQPTTGQTMGSVPPRST